MLPKKPLHNSECLLSPFFLLWVLNPPLPRTSNLSHISLWIWLIRRACFSRDTVGFRDRRNGHIKAHILKTPQIKSKYFNPKRLMLYCRGDGRSYDAGAMRIHDEERKILWRHERLCVSLHKKDRWWSVSINRIAVWNETHRISEASVEGC